MARSENVFAGREGQRVYAADGDVIRGRDRFSVAELNQYALEWRGQFVDDKLTATVGVRAPFFKRELNQYCYTPERRHRQSSHHRHRRRHAVHLARARRPPCPMATWRSSQQLPRPCSSSRRTATR